MNPPTSNAAAPASLHTAGPVSAATAALPEGPLTTAELTALVPRSDRGAYRRLWRGFYRREDQADDLWMRSLALARSRPDGVLRGRSAALLWGDDTAPADTRPEIWLPVASPSPSGRVYRSGRLTPACVTEVAGVRVTTALRTCRDLAAELPLEDAVVAVDRLCERDPSQLALVRAAIAHPATREDEPLRRVVALLDPRALSIDQIRVRAVLADAGFDRFDHGHSVRLGWRRVDLPLADPVLRCAVFVDSPRGVRRICDEPTARELRRAGWTLVTVRPDQPGELHAVPDPATPPAAGRPAAPVARRTNTPAARRTAAHVEAVARAVVGRWPATRVREPLDVAPAADPHGIWAG